MDGVYLKLYDGREGTWDRMNIANVSLRLHEFEETGKKVAASAYGRTKCQDVQVGIGTIRLQSVAAKSDERYCVPRVAPLLTGRNDMGEVR